MISVPPLLQIASGGKPRARRLLVQQPKELALHIAVAKMLRDHCLPGWLWTHIPSGEPRDIRTAAKLKAMGVRRGWPDFLLVSPHGSIRCLELKRPGNKLSEPQVDFRLHCIKQGIPHTLAYTLNDALIAFDHWDCLRIKSSARPGAFALDEALP